MAQREKITEHILESVWTDPDNLLPKDRTLFGEDFGKLVAADASDQVYWSAGMELALKAAALGSERKPLCGSRHYNPPTIPHCPAPNIIAIATVNDALTIDTKGSMCPWRHSMK